MADRATFGGGAIAGSASNIIDYITISSTGNATDFGDLLAALKAPTGFSNGNSDRGISAGGQSVNTIQYITISTTGNATDFGDLLAAAYVFVGFSNATNERGVTAGGSGSDVIQYITINSTGNATDFGDLSGNRTGLAGIDNATNERGVVAGGLDGLGSRTNIIEYVTINSTGNATDFGDDNITRDGPAGNSNHELERGTITKGQTTVNVNNISYITINSTGNATDFGDAINMGEDSCGTSNGQADRGINAAGISETNVIQYITISTTGNATDFGNLTTGRDSGLAANSNASGAIPAGGQTGISGGGSTGSDSNVIDYVTINSAGNAIDFGNLSVARTSLASCSNGINERGIFGGSTYSDVIDYITINSRGNAAAFGDLLADIGSLAACSNGINERGVFGGGAETGPSYVDIIQYITINSTGNAIDFGDLTVARNILSSCSNVTNERGVFGGGGTGGDSNVIDYITINSTGNATDFGNLSLARTGLAGCSNGTYERGVFCGGNAAGGSVDNVTDYITISTPGNATDFGDLTIARFGVGATSNGVSQRGIIESGSDGITPYSNVIDYITINSAGNATDFGNVTVARYNITSTSNSSMIPCTATKWQAGVDIEHMQYMMTIDRDSTASVLYSLEASGMLIPEFVPTPIRGERGLSMGGKPATTTNIKNIDYVTISTTGNAIDFGDQNTASRAPNGACSNGINDRATEAIGYTTAASNIIEYVTISTLGDGTDFGDLTVNTYGAGAISNRVSERGIRYAGAIIADIDYWTINTPGNATTFGNCIGSIAYGSTASNAENERGLFINSSTSPSPVDYITINTPSNASDWGDAYIRHYRSSRGCSNGTNERACWQGGYSTLIDITYCTINTGGVSGDIGDMPEPGKQYGGSLSNMENERGLHLGGSEANNQTAVRDYIDYWTINTSNNSLDFGDLTTARCVQACCSNS